MKNFLFMTLSMVSTTLSMELKAEPLVIADKEKILNPPQISSPTIQVQIEPGLYKLSSSITGANPDRYVIFTQSVNNQRRMFAIMMTKPTWGDSTMEGVSLYEAVHVPQRGAMRLNPLDFTSQGELIARTDSKDTLLISYDKTKNGDDKMILTYAAPGNSSALTYMMKSRSGSISLNNRPTQGLFGRSNNRLKISGDTVSLFSDSSEYTMIPLNGDDQGGIFSLSRTTLDLESNDDRSSTQVEGLLLSININSEEYILTLKNTLLRGIGAEIYHQKGENIFEHIYFFFERLFRG